MCSKHQTTQYSCQHRDPQFVVPYQLYIVPLLIQLICRHRKIGEAGSKWDQSDPPVFCKDSMENSFGQASPVYAAGV